MKKHYTPESIAAAKASLLDLLGDNPRIYGVLDSVSASGMSRKIRHFVVGNDNIQCIDYYIAELFPNYTRDSKNNGAIVKKGCGMDMLFATVYDLSVELYGDGYKIKYTWL